MWPARHVRGAGCQGSGRTQAALIAPQSLLRSKQSLKLDRRSHRRAEAAEAIHVQEDDVVRATLLSNTLEGAPASTEAVLGRVTHVGGAEVEMDELARDAHDPAVHVATGRELRVRLADVVAVVAADYAARIDPDRISNPHGEHAEEVWALLDDT